MMNLFQRAARETRRALGINIPTTLTVMIGTGVYIAIADNFSVPDSNSAAGYVLWLIQSLAWLTTVVLVFTPLLAWNIFKVKRRDQSVDAKLRLTANSAASVDSQMKSFLRNSLSEPCYGVAKCYVFGSVVQQYPTRDVDVIIQFNSSTQDNVRINRDRLRSIESKFREFHGLGLHVQTFLSCENEALRSFLGKAGVHERLI